MTRRGRPASAADDAASDFVGTLLLVIVVVSLGSVLAVLVASSLQAPAPRLATFSAESPEAGAAEVRLLLREGEILDPRTVRLSLTRDGRSADVPRDTWALPNMTAWRPGDAATIALDPPAAEGERLDVRVLDDERNHVLGEIRLSVGRAARDLGGIPTIEANLSLDILPADGMTAGLVTLRASHPLGALAIARAELDLANFSSGDPPLALEDTGRRGDLVGGDGVWSGLLRVPTGTEPADYNLTLNVTDAAGALVGRAVVPLTVAPPTCIGCGNTGTSFASEGTRVYAPTSANITELRLRNFVWDRLHPERLLDDAMTFRITSGEGAWSCKLDFTYDRGAFGLSEMRLWDNAHETVYVPRNGTILPIDGLDMDVLNPVASLQWVRASGSGDPLATYTNANVTGEPTLILAFLRDESATGTSPEALDMGIFSVDVVVT